MIETVETLRLSGRRIKESDCEYLSRMYKDPVVMEAMGGVMDDAASAEAAKRQANDWAQHGTGYWIFFHKDTGAFVGRGGIRKGVFGGREGHEIGIALMPDYEAQGYASEIVTVSIQTAFEKLGLERVEAFTLPVNMKSRRLLGKFFLFEREGFYKGWKHLFFYIDKKRYAALAMEWSEA